MTPDTPSATAVRTERLIIRPIPPAVAARLPEDREAAAALLGAALDAEWPLPDLLEMLPAQAKVDPGEARFGAWVMVERATNTVVGDIGFLGPPDEAGVGEIGYSVVPSRRQRGYATEAVAGLVAWAFDQPQVSAIVAGTERDNAASQRVLARAGFERTADSPSEIRWRLERGGLRA